MRTTLLLSFFLIACSPEVTPPLKLAGTCELNGIRVEIEEGAVLQQYAIGYRVPGISGMFGADPSVTDPSQVPGGLWAYDFNGAKLDTETGCAHYARVLQFERALYETRWGVVDLNRWTVRIRAGRSVLTTIDAAGDTLFTILAIDLTTDALQYFPHELHHRQLGESSWDHHGWCLDFEPWEESALEISEVVYLKC